MLASAIYSQPGAYAVLLGSGISRPAGILTGWQIALDLVHQAAVAEDPDDEESHALAAADPEAWWRQHARGDFGYSNLLEALSPSAAARQGRLARYFETSERDLEDDLKQPTAAHEAIAELARGGWMQVIVTANFDRLMEDALTAASVPHKVIDRPEQAPDGAVAIARGMVTVIKVNGDWADLDSRNTVQELVEYPAPLVDLLKRIFSEYGLLICAWSAEWDKALVRVLESTPRRYPLYWDSRSSNKEDAQRILTRVGGHVIQAADADRLFRDLTSSVDALQLLAEPPLETAIAIARLKRALPDPIRRIELHDLIDGKVDDVTASLGSTFEGNANAVDPDVLLDNIFKTSKPLLALLVNGVRYDDGTHTRLWTDALQRLMEANRFATVIPAYEELQHYPALLVLRAMRIEAIRHGRENLLIELLTRPRWTNHRRGNRPLTAAGALAINLVLDARMVNNLPRWGSKMEWSYPASHLLKTALEDFFAENGVDPDTYRTLCDDVEYRTGLVQLLLPPEQSAFGGPNSGEFVHARRWEPMHSSPPPTDPWSEVPAAENRFRSDFARNASSENWFNLFGERSLDEVVEQYRGVLQTYKKY